TSPLPPRPHPSSPTRRSSDLAVPAIFEIIADAGHGYIEQFTFGLACIGSGGHDKVHLRQENGAHQRDQPAQCAAISECFHNESQDRKSTRLNSSHVAISYAVF